MDDLNFPVLDEPTHWTQVRPAIMRRVTTAACCALLAMSAWPGLVEGVLLEFPGVCGTLPSAFILAVLVVARSVAELLPGRAPGAPGEGRHSLGLLTATVLLLLLHVPRRVVLVVALPLLMLSSGQVDPRGGSYIRTFIWMDGISPDSISYGFARDPNADGTPFGNARYERQHLMGRWYSFSVSNDW